MTNNSNKEEHFGFLKETLAQMESEKMASNVHQPGEVLHVDIPGGKSFYFQVPGEEAQNCESKLIESEELMEPEENAECLMQFDFSALPDKGLPVEFVEFLKSINVPTDDLEGQSLERRR